MSTLRLLLIGIIGLIIVSAFSVSAASNTVPATNLDESTFPITVEDLAPDICTDNIDMTNANIVVDGDGGPDTDLILGTAAFNNMSGGGGDDCILGGDNFDLLGGDDGNDVIVGGTGFDIIGGGPGNDLCYGEWLFSCNP